MKISINSLKLVIKNNIPIAIFLIAFIARLSFVIYETDTPSSDASYYDRLGASISKGCGYVDDNGVPDSFSSPFYPAFLAIIYKFFGHSYFAVRFIQSIIGAFTSIFIFLIGKRAYSFFAGILASFISIAYSPFIKSAGLLRTENIFTFILILIVFYLLRIRENMKLRDSIMLGLLLGLSILTKSMMLFFPIFIIPVFIYLKDKYRISEVLKRYGLILLTLVFLLMPWVIRNYNVYHKFVPTSAEGGFSFYSSYCPANGIFGLNAAPDDPVVIEGFKISSPVLRSKFFIKKTLDFIVNNPKKVIILEIKKFLYFWTPFDWEIVGERWFNFIYIMLAPFFVWSFFIAIKDFRKNYPILIPIIYFQIMTLVFYGSPRFRLPIEPYIFILGAVGILQCYKRIFARKCEV